MATTNQILLLAVPIGSNRIVLLGPSFTPRGDLGQLLEVKPEREVLPHSRKERRPSFIRALQWRDVERQGLLVDGEIGLDVRRDDLHERLLYLTLVIAGQLRLSLSELIRKDEVEGPGGRQDMPGVLMLLKVVGVGSQSAGVLRDKLLDFGQCDLVNLFLPLGKCLHTGFAAA
jgi:hypothetical protein